MLRSRAFTKITKKGAVVKVVKEHYLRDDIPCGLKGCQAGCNDHIKTLPEDDKPGQLVLLMDPMHEDALPNRNISCPKFILVPDTNILLHLMDALEVSGGIITEVVILQTVLEEVKARNLQMYNRARNLISRPDKRFFVFSNEHHRECFAGEKGSVSMDSDVVMESDNDRNDRAIRMATAWYRKHLAQIYGENAVEAVLLTHDAGNAEKAAADGLCVLNMSSFVKGLPDEIPAKAGLLDIVDAAFSKPAEDSDNHSSVKERYPEYMAESALKAGIESGKFYRGNLQASSYNPFIGTISTNRDGTASTIHIPNKLLMNRAMHGDVVVVELLPKSEWTLIEANESVGSNEEAEVKPSKDIANEGLVHFPPLEAAPSEAADLAPVSQTATQRPCGKVVGILRRSQKAFVGSIDKSAVRPEAALQSLTFYPMDRRIPRIRIRTRQAQQLAGQRILVAFDEWAEDAVLPRGHFVKDLGPAGDRATEVAAILLAHDVNSDPFAPAVTAELPKEGPAWRPTDKDYAERTDLRHLDICSIDPPGCTDIDDALHARLLANGNVEVGVHIADVTHFVPANGAMDREAAARSTTVYLVDRRIDMLPALLGSDLCSLKGNVERLAFSCVWEMDLQSAQILSTKFFRSVISSKSAFTYDQAQERLDRPGNWYDFEEQPGTDEKAVSCRLMRSVKLLAFLARQLKARRIEAGALTLASPEVRFNIDTTTANPVDVEVKEMREANSLVEEFMLLANVSVARKLLEHFPQTALLRRHPTPPAENFEALNRALAPYGFSLDPSESKKLQASLDSAVKPDDDYFNRLVRIMATRCMYQAQYFASGTLIEELYWHYGLACPLYTHFTSPIRRYADVLVHRLLAMAINAPGALSLGLASDKQLLADTCDNLNYRNRMAQQAQRASIELFTALFFRGKRVTEEAYLIRVMKNAAIALVPKYGMECIIPLEDFLSTNRLAYDPERNLFADPTSGKSLLQLFQCVKVEITVEELEISMKQRLMIKLVEPDLSLLVKSPSPKRKHDDF